MSTKQFKIICLKTGLFWNADFKKGCESPTVYDDGALAERHAANLTTNTGLKWQVRPHITDTRWRERETKRFYDGTYFPVPWETQSWWRGSYADAHHFAHISVEKDTRIAFTPDDEAGVADKQTRIKPGRYLERYFGARINNETIKHWAAQFSVLYETIEVKFAKTADEIEKVYMEGPRSCMDGLHAKAGNFIHAGMHPCRVYAGPDLAVAYLEKEDDDTRMVCGRCQDRPGGCPQSSEGTACAGATKVGTYSARCLVWPEKKLFGRIYGDTDRLKLALQRDGYKADSYLQGARFTRVPVVRKGYSVPTFVVPYIDGGQRVGDDGEYLVIDTKGYINGGSANGIGEDMRQRCPECEELSSSEFVNVLDHDGTRSQICRSCYDHDEWHRCRETGHQVRRNDAIVTNAGAVHIRYIEDFFEVCAKTHTLIDVHYDQYIRMSNGSAVVLTWFNENHGAYCDYCGNGIADGINGCIQTMRCKSQFEKQWFVRDDARDGLGIYHTGQKKPPAGAVLMVYREAQDAYAEIRDEKRRQEREAAAKAHAEAVAARRRAAQRARRAREREARNALAQRSGNGVPL